MGIRSLGSFMQDHGCLRKYCLCNTRLVIDGKNLCHMLMENSYHGFRYGGNYDHFRIYVENLFHLLRNCHVEPYVVMDGALDPDEKKCARLLDRCEKRILEISKGDIKCFPILTHRVFIHTVKKLGIQIAGSNYEADRVIAGLASSWKCPVLSNDNDFFIYDLPGGYIRYTDLNWRNDCKIEDITCVNTWIYYTKHVQSCLGINPSLLPLMAVFLDNDYFTLDAIITETFISQKLDIPISEASRRLKKPIDAVRSIIEALRTTDTVTDAIEILSECLHSALFLNPANKIKIVERANAVLKQFNISDITATDLGSSLFDANFKECNGEVQILLPAWLLKSIRACEVSPFVVNVLSKNVILKPNLEDLSQECMYNITSSLRQVIYKLVTGKKLQEVIVEYHRLGCHMGQTRVFPMTARLKLGKLPTLSCMINENEELRLSFMCKFFQFSIEKLDKIPKCSKMFVLALNYFTNNSGLKESVKGIKCLLFCHMLLIWKEYGHIYEHPLSPQCVQQVFDFCWDNYGVPFDIELMHEFQRFQIVVEIMYDLNGLFLFPVMTVNPCVMYKGGLMYTLFTKTDNEQHLDRIIEMCFKEQLTLATKLREIVLLILDHV